jgi:lysozyme
VTEPARTPAPVAKKPLGKTLLGIVGSIGAVAALFTMTPLEESGRKVEAHVTADGAATLRHVAGPQYLTAYRDIVGVVTICDGDTADVKAGQVATPPECTARLERQLIVHAEGVVACVPQLYGRQHQVTAAVLLAYNIGVRGFCGSTAARLFRAGRLADGCRAFGMWNKAGGRVVRGLTLRRGRETAECLRGLA